MEGEEPQSSTADTSNRCRSARSQGEWGEYTPYDASDVTCVVLKVRGGDMLRVEIRGLLLVLGGAMFARRASRPARSCFGKGELYYFTCSQNWFEHEVALE